MIDYRNPALLFESFKNFRLQLPEITRSAIMLDIETAGLRPGLPIVQIAIADMEDAVNGKVQSFQAVPIMGFLRDMQPDAEGRLDYSIKAQVANSRQEFQSMFGNWALENEDYGVNRFYETFEQLPQLQKSRLINDLLYRDTIKFSDYGVLGSEESWLTPRGVAKKSILMIGDAAAGQKSIVGQTLPFESLRLGQLMSFFLPGGENKVTLNDAYLKPLNDDPDIVKAFGRPLNSFSDLKSYFEASYSSPYKANILDPNNLGYEAMKAEAGKPSIHLLNQFNSKSVGGIRNVDMQDLTRMIFSAVEDIGIVKKSEDTFSGTNIDLASRFFYGVKESHTAAEDVAVQARLLKKLSEAAPTLEALSSGVAANSSFTDKVKGIAYGVYAQFTGNSTNEVIDYVNAVRGVEHDFEFTGSSGLTDTYKGTISEIMKKRSLEKTMVTMDQSLRAYLNLGNTEFSDIQVYQDYKGNSRVYSPKREAFTLSRSESGFVDYRTNDGRTVSMGRNRPTGKEGDYANWARNFYDESLKAGIAPDEAWDKVRELSIENYLKTKAGQGQSKEELWEISQRVGLRMEHSITRENYVRELFEQGDTAFKDSLFETVGKPSGKSYLRDITQDLMRGAAKQKGLGLGIGALAIGYAAYRYGVSDDYHIEDMPTTKSLMENAQPLAQVEGAPQEKRTINLSDYNWRLKDGDTLLLQMKGKTRTETIRLDGIDAPEVSHGKGPAMFGAESATARLTQILSDNPNARIEVSESVSTYGRKAGIVYGDDGSNINLQMVREGQAAALIGLKGQNTSGIDLKAFAEAEQLAYKKRLGIWKSPEMRMYQQIPYHDRLTFNRIKEQQDLQIMPMSGKDDAHNTLEALGHAGIAHTLRRQMSDFGSGWRGLLDSTALRAVDRNLGKLGTGIYKMRGDTYRPIIEQVLKANGNPDLSFAARLDGVSVPVDLMAKALRSDSLPLRLGEREYSGLLGSIAQDMNLLNRDSTFVLVDSKVPDRILHHELGHSAMGMSRLDTKASEVSREIVSKHPESLLGIFKEYGPEEVLEEAIVRIGEENFAAGFKYPAGTSPVSDIKFTARSLMNEAGKYENPLRFVENSRYLPALQVQRFSKIMNKFGREQSEDFSKLVNEAMFQNQKRVPTIYGKRVVSMERAVNNGDISGERVREILEEARKYGDPVEKLVRKSAQDNIDLSAVSETTELRMEAMASNQIAALRNLLRANSGRAMKRRP